MPTILGRSVMAGSLGLLAVLAACSGSTAPIPPEKTTATTGPTFHKDVEPILVAHCQSCHSPGNLAPFSLLTYKHAKALAQGIVDQTGQRKMPPWGAQSTAECTPPFAWKKDARISDAEIDLLAAWHANGDAEGDPKDAPAPRVAPAPGLPMATAELTPVKPFVTAGDRDQFRCFSLDPKLGTDQFVNGVAILPGNAKVVHHAVLVTDPKGTAAALAGPDGSFDCPTGMGTSGDTTVLGVWTPGGVPTELPSNIGTPIAAGTKLLMQIHYHPGGLTAAPDATRVQLRFTSGKPEYLLYTTAVGNYPKLETSGDGLQPSPTDAPTGPEFRIPAGATSHVARMRFTMPATINGFPTPTIYIYGLMAHEHLAGVDVKVDLETAATKASTCLLQDRWDFHWQRMYSYDTAIANLPILHAGDRLNVRCTYNNSLGNPRLAEELAAQRLMPRDVTLGEQTLDEMCLAIPQLLVRAP